jgi:hypothetical protein
MADRFDIRPFEQKRREEQQRRSAVAIQERESRSAALAVQEREALTLPVAAPAQLEDPNVFDIEEYKALVQELGVDDSAIRNYEFRLFLNSEGIEVYPYEKVTTFLDAKVKKEANPNLVWVWKPINGSYPPAPRNRSGLPSMMSISISAMQASTERLERSIFLTGTLVPAESNPVRKSNAYTRPLPQAVLMTVKKIRDKFRDALFYASDYEVRDPDPFLMVTGPGLDYYVIERWDEPTFRS